VAALSKAKAETLAAEAATTKEQFQEDARIATAKAKRQAHTDRAKAVVDVVSKREQTEKVEQQRAFPCAVFSGRSGANSAGHHQQQQSQSDLQQEWQEQQRRQVPRGNSQCADQFVQYAAFWEYVAVYGEILGECLPFFAPLLDFEINQSSNLFVFPQLVDTTESRHLPRARHPLLGSPSTC
jgi:hypothetical protein